MRCKCRLVGFAVKQVLRTAVLINLSTGDCGWQQLAGQPLTYKTFIWDRPCLFTYHSSHSNLLLFPLSLHLALEVSSDLLFRDAQTPLVNIKFHQIYGFPAFLQLRFQEYRYIGEKIFSESWKKTRWKLRGLEIYGGGRRSEMGKEF